MSRIQNVTRKNGTYYFRRLIRLGDDKPFRLRLSLRTSSHARARTMAPALAVASEALRVNMMHKIGRDGLTSAERAEVFRRQMLRERDWLETAPVQLQLADLRGELPEDLLSLRLDAEEAISRDRSVNGGVSPALALIIPDDDAPADVPIQIVAWDEIENSLGAEDAMEAAQMHLANLGIASTPLRLQMAHKIVHDARITAIRDYRKRLDNPSTAYPSVPVHFQEMAPVPDAVASARSVTHDHAVEAPPASTPGAGADSIWRQMGAFEAAAQFIEANPKTGGAEGDVRKHGKIWTKKTRDQFELPALLLEQVMEGRPLADVTDADLGRLNVCFNRLHGPSFRKSPRQCKMTIQEIVAETQERIKNGEIHRRDVGLGVSTTNRHWGYLRQLTKWFSRHQPIANLDYSAFIYQDMRDPRELSETYSIEEGEMVFSLPPWNGCEPIKRLKPGPFIIHDACYFVPLIAWYTGLRRDEISGLELIDIVFDEGFWHFHIRENDTRGLKTVSSRRLIPMASELVRLGLPDYVESLRREGEVHLFPELRPQSGIGNFGDAFYKIWWVKLAKYLPFLVRRQAVHSFRHTLTDELKAKDVSEELRADLVGHRLQSETAGRYSKASRISKMREAVEKVPKVTKRLRPAPIELLPALKRAGRKARPKEQRR